MEYRIEHDSLGDVQVPADAFYGAQTQRAIDNFQLSGLPLPRTFIRALGLIKSCAARVNSDLGLLDSAAATAIEAAAERVAAGELDGHFPIDVFQTGSGTSTNMNANEVIAHCATAALGRTVHPNDHVNMSQSSNDVIPTAIHVGASLLLEEVLMPGLESLAATIESRARGAAHIVKTGRTHLMDAMPLTVAQEVSAWAAQIRHGLDRIGAVRPRLHALAQGGTAVGTGVNAPADFGARVARALAQRTGIPFAPSGNFFEALSCQDTAVELSGQLKTTAVGLMKIANDLRWMNSGPLAGLREIELPALQPGSSIMPGKLNPVVPESVAMVCAQVIGNDAALTVAGQSGNFQLNVMLPLIAYDLLQSTELLGRAARLLGERAIAGMVFNEDRLREQLSRNPILVTGLNARFGYEQGAKIARQAYAQGRPVIDVAAEVTGMSEAELERLLDPSALTRPGIPT
ncbi:MAG: class II fumarate hydratase [Betaproteobacteria bacterium]|nr:MAG: class II fumarate hydratase [Betaproteobacteria bacterium]RPI48798.1 MAG: class II fumarate hydratase [Betaproteobacteria bacterium]